MAKEDETPGANPAEIENLIEQIRGGFQHNLFVR
jgi:hypothetical protein